MIGCAVYLAHPDRKSSQHRWLASFATICNPSELTWMKRTHWMKHSHTPLLTPKKCECEYNDAPCLKVRLSR